MKIGDRVRIGPRTGTVEAIGLRDIFVRLDDNGALRAFQPQYVRKIA